MQDFGLRGGGVGLQEFRRKVVVRNPGKTPKKEKKEFYLTQYFLTKPNLTTVLELFFGYTKSWSNVFEAT